MSEGFCDVSLGDYDGDAASVFRSHMVRARKPHRCYECRDQISIGQQYERVNGLWEHTWSTYRFCLPCSEIQREFSENGRTFGEMWNQLQDFWEEGAHLQACLNRLTTVAAKEHMRRWWLEWKRLA